MLAEGLCGPGGAKREAQSKGEAAAASRARGSELMQNPEKILKNITECRAFTPNWAAAQRVEGAFAESKARYTDSPANTDQRLDQSQNWRRGTNSAPLPGYLGTLHCPAPQQKGFGVNGCPGCPPAAHLHLLPHVVPVGDEVVECVLGVLHVAAVLAVNQQPGEGEMANVIGNTCWQLEPVIKDLCMYIW